MDTVQFLNVQVLNRLLIRVARRVEVKDADVAIRINELQIQQREQVVVFKIGLFEKLLDVSNLVQPGGASLTPNRLLTCRSCISHQDQSFFVEGGGGV